MLSVWLINRSPKRSVSQVRSALEEVTPIMNTRYLPTIEDTERSGTVTFSARPECPCVSRKKMKIHKRKIGKRKDYEKINEKQI